MSMIKYISITVFMLALFTNVIARSNTDTIYTYYDAARNKYILIKKDLEYIPVKASESSAGIYSGGTYESKALTEKESKKLVRFFKAALTNKKAQTNKNTKPNAAVEISSNNKKINFLLIATSAINISLHHYLKQILKLK